MEELTVPLSRIEYYILGFRLTGTQRSSRSGGSIETSSSSQIDANGRLMTLGDFPVDLDCQCLG